ncbi:hypothetical protein SLEP1_g58143 [Rubroshorea leprosula]|uniref:Uncharacterized protein n=1 Tax=Rubroshorea leprosula TaxID=152421 RepID=A0AAV5MNH5_9ROSI|nr:hypothetical protein SLEP1_g58143 [Rubroshorea leprosula]
MIVSYVNAFQFCNKGSETVGGTDQPQGRKRKNREISKAGQPAEKEGMGKDAKYRAKKKVNVFIISFAGIVLNFYYIMYFQVAQQELEKEKNDLKAENEELKREIGQLKWDRVGLEKQVLELKAEVKEAVADKERAVAEKERTEKSYFQKELEKANQKLEEMAKYDPFSDLGIFSQMDGSVSLPFLLKLLKTYGFFLLLHRKKPSPPCTYYSS